MRKSRIVAVLFTVVAISGCGSTTSPANTSPASSPDTSSPDTTSPDSASPVTTSPGSGPAVTVPASSNVSGLIGRDWLVDGHYTIGGLQPVVAGSTAALRFSDDGDG